MKLECLKAIIANEPQIRDILEKLDGDRADFDVSQFIVAKNKKEIIGCVRIKVFLDGSLELASLAVLPGYQGKGIGSELIRKLLLSEPARPIFLLTSLDKENFYKRFDFNIINTDNLPEELKKEYLHVVRLPFAKNIQVIAMVLK